MDILTLEGTEIYTNSLGLQDQKLIYRTECGDSGANSK